MKLKSRKVFGASIIECSIALGLLLSVTFMITSQDISSMNQSANDARMAVATMFLGNEVARLRNSLSPDQDGSFIADAYPKTAGASILVSQIPLAFVNRNASTNTPFKGDVTRTWESTSVSGDIRYNTYRVDVLVPRLLGNKLTNEVFTRRVSRSFHEQN